MVSTPNIQPNIAMQAGQGVPLNVNVDTEKLKQGVDNSYLANRVKASADEQTNPLIYAGTGTAIWYGISQGMDVFNRNCAKEYEKTAFGKLGAWGDKVATKWNGTAIGGFFNNLFGRGKNLSEWMSQKSHIAHALKNHSTNPEWGFAKTPGAGIKGFLAMDMAQVFDEYLEPISKNSNRFSWFVGKNVNPQRLEQYGMSKADIIAFRDTLRGKTFAEKALAIQKKELQLLGVKHERLAKCDNIKALERLAYRIKVRRLGFDSIEQYNMVKKDILGHSKEVMEALKKATKNGDVVVPIWRKAGTGSGIQNHLLGRQASLLEYLNKYKAALGQGNKTALGRFLPKALAWFMEGSTNRFAGGKIAVALQAGIFADMLVKTFQAPKGEKGKTLAERFVNDFTYFMAMPLGIVAMHKVGGLKYAGMTTEQVKAYRAALKQFNSDVKAGLLSDKSAYKARAKELKNMLKADVKNPITKLFKKLGGFINIGNETKLARRSTAKWNLNLFRKSGNFFRNLAGVPLRIAIPLMMISPFLAKLTTKGAHSIFGKPTKSVLDEGKEEETVNKAPTAEQQKAFQEAMAKAAQAQAQAAAQKQVTQVPQSQTNLINQYVNRANVAQTPAGQAVQNLQPQQVQPPVQQQSATLADRTTSTVQKQPSETLADKNNIQKQPSETLVTKTNTTKTTSTTTTTTTTPQSETLAKKAEPAKKRYIPNPSCQVKGNPNEDYSKAENAMRKFDEAEQMVNNTLAMRW